MTLKPGTMVGPYEVRELIGKGGMGEVYRGFDTKLKRDVALKSLPEQFARDPERVARFRREAQLLASLNHTNIAAIYGLEESGETPCLVMEYVPGETLRDRLIREGAAPLEEALEIGKQILEALEHAHEKGIIHRDLKPANVKLTPEGQVKVLDFGLAKAFAGDSAEVSESQAPTVLTASPTIPGTILGTAAYMSPEQAKGKTVDKRTDIWAFGCVLYELLTGKQAFGGEDVSETLASVLKAEPDWTAFPAETPHGIRVLLRRCLQKDAKRRYRDAADIQIQIEEAQAAPSMTSAASATPSAKQRERLAWALAATSILVAVVFAGSYFRREPAGTLPVRFQVSAPEGTAFTSPGRLLVSPDGQHLAFIAQGGGGLLLWVRRIDSFTAQPLAGTEGVSNPFWSADSRYIAFTAGGKLKKIEASGGPAQTLTDSAGGGTGAWNLDGDIIFRLGSTLHHVSEAGGTARPVTELDGSLQQTFHRSPVFLPDGRRFIYFAQSSNPENSGIYAASLDSKERVRLVNSASSADFAPPGYLLFVRQATLMAQPFDAAGLRLSGEPTAIAEQVRINASDGYIPVSVSRSGVLAYESGSLSNEGQLVWVDRKGAVEPLPAPLRAYGHPQLSPDGRRLAVTIADEGSVHVWVYDLARGVLSRLTFEGDNQRPLWTPDGKRIAFRSTRPGGLNLFWKAADGTGAEEQLTNSKGTFGSPSSISPDGDLAFYSETHPTTGRDIWMVSLKGERKASPFLQTPFTESVPRISPDGRWLAHVSNESGRNEVYVRPFPAGPGRWQISTDGGEEPLWARNGRELFYRAGNKVMAVEISALPSFQAGTPRLLFEGEYFKRTAGETNYEISPDGQRLLMVRRSEDFTNRQFNVVVNWVEEMRRRGPAAQ